MVHTLFISLGLYIVIAILMVPCRLLPIMLWPLYCVVEDHAEKLLLPMTLRRFSKEPIPSELLMPVFLTSPLYFAGGLIIWIANEVTKAIARPLNALRRRRALTSSNAS